MYKEVEFEAGTIPKPENKPVSGDTPTIFQRDSVGKVNINLKMTVDGHQARIVLTEASEGSIEM